MSGIFALMHFDGRPVDPALARKMAAGMSTIGPDGQDVWTQGAVAIGCASFHTVPEQVGSPNPLREGDIVLALDGRIDNRRELRAACRGQHIEIAAAADDAAYVLAAYRAWGVDAPAHLIGEWAFVLWDGHKRRLLAARDHMAVRSLRWWADTRTLIVSSAFRPILDHPDVRTAPNEGVIAEWLNGTPTTLEGTLWHGISSVPGGRRLLSAAGGSLRVDRFWEPTEHLGDEVRSESEAREHLVAAVEEAVRCRMRLIGTPEIEVSGGWDSTTVAAVAHDLNTDEQIQNFALSAAVYPGQRHDETPYIDSVGAHLGRMINKRPQSLLTGEESQAAVRASGHPWPRDISRRLRPTTDFRVLLSGEGGNETLGGMWNSAASISLAPFIVGRQGLAATTKDFLHRVVRPVVRPHLPRPVRIRRQPYLAPWVAPDLAKRTALSERLADAEPLPTRGTTRQRELLRWLDFWGVHHTDLTRELDRGLFVELRHPLLDVRLVEVAIRMPARFSGTVRLDPRKLHREAFGHRLPALVTARTWGTDFDELRRAELGQLRAQCGECPRLRAEGLLTAAGWEILEARISSSDPLPWAASLLYSVELWMTSQST